MPNDPKSHDATPENLRPEDVRPENVKPTPDILFVAWLVIVTEI